MPPSIHLASQSPRRQDLLRQIGISFNLLQPAHGKEAEEAEQLERHRAGESVRHYVQRVTALKAGAAVLRRAARNLPDLPILAADTTVALGGELFGKPADAADAAAMLARLAGRTHRVLTAIAVTDGRRMDLALSESRVTFAPLSAAEIERYVASGEPFGKAGAYAIQGRAAAFITHVSGSHSGIVGLPLAETATLLARFGVVPQ